MFAVVCLSHIVTVFINLCCQTSVNQSCTSNENKTFCMIKKKKNTQVTQNFTHLTLTPVTHPLQFKHYCKLSNSTHAHSCEVKSLCMTESKSCFTSVYLFVSLAAILWFFVFPLDVVKDVLLTVHQQRLSSHTWITENIKGKYFKIH